MAGSRSIGGIFAELTLRDIKFRRGLAAARQSLNNFAAKGAMAAGVATGAMAAGLVTAGVALAAGTRKTIAAGAALDDMSANTGVAIGDLMQIRKAYQLGGASADAAGKDIQKMQRSLVDAASGKADPFAKLGLSAEKLLGQNPAEQFHTIGDAISRIVNPAEKSAAAMEIFGRSGGGLVNVFGQMEGASRFLGRQPEIMQKYGAAMARADELIEEMPGKSQQFFTGFTAGVIGEVLPLLERTNEFDFSDLGENLGQKIAAGLGGLTDSRPWEVFGLHAAAEVNDFGRNIANGLAAAINAGFDVGQARFDEFSRNFGDFIVDEIVNIVSPEGGPLRKVRMDQRNKEVAERALAAGYSPLGGGAPVDPGETFAALFDKYKNLGQDDTDAPGDYLRKQADSIWNGFAASMAANLKDAADMATSGKSPTGNPISTLEQPNKFTDSAAEVNDYQRRGLSLGGTTSTITRDKELAVLEKIYKALRDANRTQPTPAF